MNRPVRYLCSFICLISTLTGPLAYAQQSGLRLEGSSPSGFVLRDSGNGLHLEFSTYAVPTLTPFNVSPTQNSWTASHNTLSANWSVLDSDEIHTSLGLVWDSNRNSAGTFSEAQGSGLSRSFLGLSWDSKATSESRWALSAQVGTNLFHNKNCSDAFHACSSSGSFGLTANPLGDGLHLNPYISFGATYSFDR